MGLSWFYELNPYWILLFLCVAMMLAAEAGFLAGRRREEVTGDKGRGYFGAVLGSMLGILALLLGFSFQISAQTNDLRRQLVIDDAIAINDIYLQSTLLPQAERILFQKVLRVYVDERALLRPGLSLDVLTKYVIHAGQLQKQMWDLAADMAQRTPAVKNAEGLLPPLGNAQATHERRIFAYRNRTPEPIVLLLLAAAIICMGAVGYAAGLGLYRGMVGLVMLDFLIGGTIFVILELQQPRHGLVKIDQTPILRMKQVIDQALAGVP